MTTKKKLHAANDALHADLQMREQGLEALEMEVDLLKASHILEHSHRPRDLTKKDGVVYALTGLIHYQHNSEANAADIAIVRGEKP